jgi:DtxR family transcriptional regulator, manganese transport regulator
VSSVIIGNMKKSPTHKTKRNAPISGTASQVAGKSRPGNKDNPFAAARRDHSSETAEDYVEAVALIAAENGQCRIIDLARTFAVSSVTVNRTIARLKRDGWVDVEPYGPVLLTEAGKQLAERCRLRHETVLNFLLSLGVSPETAEIDAEGIEHHVSAETLQAMSQHIAQAISPGKKSALPRSPKRP